MKTFKSSLLISFLLLFIACNQKTKSIPEKELQKEVSKDTISQKVDSHESELKTAIDLTSKLKEKVARLAELEYNYQLKSLEVVPPEKTILIGNFQRILRLNDSTSKNIDIPKIKKSIHEIRKSFLKGKKPMQPNGNLYPRVTIEEYIFKTPESAKIAFETLKKSKKNRRIWNYIKSPSELFIEANRIYFVNSGGFYMMDIYKDIVEKIKD